MRYMVVIEKGAFSYGAFVPDLPGCIAVGETEAEALSLIEEAIRFHRMDQAGISGLLRCAPNCLHAGRKILKGYSRPRPVYH